MAPLIAKIKQEQCGCFIFALVHNPPQQPLVLAEVGKGFCACRAPVQILFLLLLSAEAHYKEAGKQNTLQQLQNLKEAFEYACTEATSGLL